MARRDQGYQTIRSEGGLLPTDLLGRVGDPSSKLIGTTPADYQLLKGERLNEKITQSWNRLRGQWEDFRESAASLDEGEAGTGLTNEKWTLPVLRELGFGSLPTTPGPEIEGKSYPISRFLGPVPIHLIGCGLSLDRRSAGQRGAASTNPHGLVQEFLNRSDDHLWGIASNGLRLRILRDSQALSRQSYLEFDLEAMFDGDVYSDFVVLWLVGHATRFVPKKDDEPESCLLEQWTKEAEQQGTRALGDLQMGVQKALQILGQGFTNHPRNTDLREALSTGRLSPTDLHGELLRVVYRLIFLFVAEDRTIDNQPLLHPIDSSQDGRSARERYATHYSAGRLREIASKIKGSRHGDLWRQFQVVVGALSGHAEFEAARRELALPVFGSFLWDPEFTADLNEAELTNHDFLEALRHLAFTRQGKVLRPVDYKNLGAEELGGVYESLLALTPQISGGGRAFTFAEFAGNERKTSGSYYTPDSLVRCLLDTTVDPIVADAIRGKTGRQAEEAILSLTVCDPAVGSGHFLVGAARRMANHLSRARARAAGETEPSPLEYQRALRDVIGRCLYGVDVNPMAAELCRVGLWLEALEPGKPLTFLDHHIRVGNSLIGATPELIAAGIPDAAFKPLEGDDPDACKYLKKRNQGERSGIGGLFEQQDTAAQAKLAAAAARLTEMPDDRPEDVKAKERALRVHEDTAEYKTKKAVADAWCAAFFIEKRLTERGRDASAVGITQQHLDALADGQTLPAPLASQINDLCSDHGFFQWHLAFPEVFAAGGFDCLVGNPPWERVKLQEQEFFASRDTAVAKAKNAAARKKLIAQLPETNPQLSHLWNAEVRRATAESNFFRDSCRFPLGGVGDVNTYAVFADLFRQSIKDTGRAGLILPNGLVTGFTYRKFLKALLDSKTLASFYGFENEDLLFPAVTNKTKFGILTVTGRARPIEAPRFTAHLRQPEQVHDPKRAYSLTAEQIEAISPNTLTLPAFRWAQDAEVTAAIHRTPVLVRKYDDGREDNPWAVTLKTLFHMAGDSEHFLDHEDIAPRIVERRGALAILEDGSEVYPLYEGKMYWHFDHRYGTYEGQTQKQANKGVLPHVDDLRHDDPEYRIQPRYWVDAERTRAALGDAGGREWFYSWRDVGISERTLIGTVCPMVATGHVAPVMTSGLPANDYVALATLLSTLVADYSARQHSLRLSFFVVEQVAVLNPDILIAEHGWLGCSVLRWLADRSLELGYTSHELSAFAHDLGWSGQPFRWLPKRRTQIQAEIDAVAMHLYGLDREQAEWLLDSFTVLRKYEERDHGEFRTKRLVLEVYDTMQAAKDGGSVYQTPLDPPPGPPQATDGRYLSPDEIGDLPPHIHGSASQDPGAPRRVPLTALVHGFPDEPFDLAVDGTMHGARLRVSPTTTGSVDESRRIVITCPGLERGGTTIPGAIGKLRADERIDSSTGEAYVAITIRTPEGIARARMTPQQWETLETIGIVEDDTEE